MINQQLNSCPAATRTMKNPILWKKKSGVLDLGIKQYPKVCTVRAQCVHGSSNTPLAPPPPPEISPPMS